MAMNYLKLASATKPQEFFVFDSENRPGSFDRAFAAARAIDPSGCIAIWRPNGLLPSGTRCVGHAPVERRSFSLTPARPEWDCANCGQSSDE